VKPAQAGSDGGAGLGFVLNRQAALVSAANCGYEG